MENLNLHKQKLYSLIVAGVALIALILPWISIDFGFVSRSINGLRSWGLLSLIGVIGVGAASFLMGDKTKEFDENTKKIALGSFAAIALGALLFFIRLSSIGGGLGSAAGLGLWLCLIAGAAGLCWVLGVIKLPDNKKPPTPPTPPTP